MLKASYKKHVLKFKNPSGTSRGILNQKVSYFIYIESQGKTGVGECSLINGLSIDAVPEVEDAISEICENINNYVVYHKNLYERFPAVCFAIETAMLDLENGGRQVLFESDFTNGKASIPLNGLIWMGDAESMRTQIKDKIDAGFSCVKLKIGALNIDEELSIISEIRKSFSSETLEIRVDANGAFKLDNVMPVLETLSKLKVHSIEQPIAQGQIEDMSTLCSKTPIPIALDEELIGVISFEKRKELLEIINPQYIIIKPSLLGGFASSMQWIGLAKKMNIGYWVTSALESNIALSAIAQWAYTLNPTIHQGLGTGQLFENNVESSLNINGGRLFFK